MIVCLEGHDCRHAVEQALLSWLPDRERVWGGSLPETGDLLVSRLFPGECAFLRSYTTTTDLQSSSKQGILIPDDSNVF